MAGRLPVFALLIACLLLLEGCATTRGVGRSRTVGIIALQGVDQLLALNVQGEFLAIRGPAAVLEQIDRLIDARIACQGPRSSDTVTVRSFEILEAPDGMVPYLGRIVYDQSGVVLADETTGTRIGLRSADLEALKRAHGDRVWITGAIVGPQLLLVAHWGVLVPASN